MQQVKRKFLNLGMVVLCTVNKPSAIGTGGQVKDLSDPTGVALRSIVRGDQILIGSAPADEFVSLVPGTILRFKGADVAPNAGALAVLANWEVILPNDNQLEIIDVSTATVLRWSTSAGKWIPVFNVYPEAGPSLTQQEINDVLEATRMVLDDEVCKLTEQDVTDLQAAIQLLEESTVLKLDLPESDDKVYAIKNGALIDITNLIPAVMPGENIWSD